jgi:hypothetical protein
MPVHCVVVLPGIMGSVLKLRDEVVWPGSALNAVLTTYGKMEELLDPDLVPSDLLRKVFVFDRYGSFLDDLEALGFHERPPSPAKPTLFVCPYDWRKDNANSAKTLDAKLAAIHDWYGDDLEISVLAHSMGGLVARYYLESSEFAGSPGFANVCRLITLGTPHYGAPVALPVVLGLERRAFLKPNQVKLVASDPRYPAAYQLLPHRNQPFAWDQGLSVLDVFDAANATRLGLVPGNLAAAAAFHAKLEPRRRPPQVRYFCFVGTRQKTTSIVRIDWSRPAGPVLKWEIDDAGDGTVPSWSASLPGIQAQQVGGEHDTLFRDQDLRLTLPVLLGRHAVLRASWPPAVEIALREDVVGPGDDIHAVLGLERCRAVQGDLCLEQARVENEAVAEWTPLVRTPLAYTGAPAQTLSIVLRAPEQPGAYRLAFYPKGPGASAGGDEFFVQM